MKVNLIVIMALTAFRALTVATAPLAHQNTTNVLVAITVLICRLRNMAAQRAIIRVRMQQIAQAASQVTISQRLCKQAAMASVLPVSIRLLHHPRVQVAQRDTIRLPQLSRAARVVLRDTIRQLRGR